MVGEWNGKLLQAREIGVGLRTHPSWASLFVLLAFSYSLLIPFLRPSWPSSPFVTFFPTYYFLRPSFRSSPVIAVIGLHCFLRPSSFSSAFIAFVSFVALPSSLSSPYLFCHPLSFFALCYSSTLLRSVMAQNVNASTLFHLIPTDDKSRMAIDYPDNRDFVSSCGQFGLGLDAPAADTVAARDPRGLVKGDGCGRSGCHRGLPAVFGESGMTLA